MISLMIMMVPMLLMKVGLKAKVEIMMIVIFDQGGDEGEGGGDEGGGHLVGENRGRGFQ